MKKILAVILISIIFHSCSTTRPEGKTEAEVLFKEAEELIDDGRYLLATEKLNLIRSQYPYSYYATHAELLNADVLFAQENFAEAAAAYIVFKDFHPKSKKRAYVIWRIAESFFSQLPDTFDRDLTPGHEAIKYYQELINLYARSEYTKDAEEKIKKAQDMIQAKEKYVADFYFKTKVYDGARYRYLTILENFKNKELREHSMIRIVQASKNLKEKKMCTTYFKMYSKVLAGSRLTELQNIHNDCLNQGE